MQRNGGGVRRGACMLVPVLPGAQSALNFWAVGGGEDTVTVRLTAGQEKVFSPEGPQKARKGEAPEASRAVVSLSGKIHGRVHAQQLSLYGAQATWVSSQRA